MGEFVTFEQQGHVAILRMNRPDSLNALEISEDTVDLANAIESLLERDVRCAVLTGNGRGFSSGGHIRSMKEKNGISRKEQPDSSRRNYRGGVHRIMRAFLQNEVPIIAAVNGAAVGLGLGIANMCEIRIGGQSAKVGSTFVKIGLVPGDGGAWSLQQLVGHSKAAEMILTGRIYNAQEALNMGLFNQLVPDDELMDTALQMAQEIAANPARAVRLSKRLLREAQQLGAAQMLEISGAFQAMAHETLDHAEAIDAMLEKRKPNFTGE